MGIVEGVVSFDVMMNVDGERQQIALWVDHNAEYCRFYCISR